MADTALPTYADIGAAGARFGLIVRGGFHPSANDGVPPLSDDRPTQTLVLLGNAGPDLWSLIGDRLAAENSVNPLDRWTEASVDDMSRMLGAEPLFPFRGPPFLPFLHWAQRAESVAPSAIGILIHPRYGLWHAYRAALAFSDRLVLPPWKHEPRPCDSCPDRPCLTTCPVDAFSGDGFDADACSGHIGDASGRECLESGCLARRACPVGRDYAYAPAQAGFHMAAFLSARQRVAAASA